MFKPATNQTRKIMNIETLKTFCASPKSDPLRLKLRAPFSIGAWTYATDGRAAVRVPRMADVPEMQEPVVGVESLFSNFPVDGFQSVDIELPPPLFQDCTACSGKGRKTECEACGGEGELECDFGHVHECEECDGDCYVFSDSGRFECEKCAGTGKAEKDQFVDIIRATFMVRLVDKIIKLPDVQWCVVDSLSVAKFKFIGGQGLLMPCLKYS